MLGTTIYDIPQEVIDRIIRSASQWGTKTLKACALTHRAWTPASQQCLHERQSYDWESGPIPSPAHYTNPKIAAMVRTLSLAVPHSPADDPDTWALLSRFSRVTKLRICATDWYCTAEDREKLHAMFGEVTHLTLSTCTWKHGHDFVYLLSAFPKITYLEIEDPTMTAEEDIDVVSYPRQAITVIPGSSLRKLAIKLVSLWGEPEDLNLGELVGPWLSHFPSVVPAGLHFEWESSVGWFAFADYIRAIGPVLESLRVSYLCDAPAPLDFGLDKCTQLRTLSIGSICWTPRSDGPVPEYSWVPRILSDVRSPHIQTVHLGFDPGVAADLNDLDFASIDTVLSEPRFIGTRVVLSFFWTMFLSLIQPELTSPEIKAQEAFMSFLTPKMGKVFRQGRLAMMFEGMDISQAWAMTQLSLAA